MTNTRTTFQLRKIHYKRLMLNILLGIVVPLLLAVILNQAIAQGLTEQKLPADAFFIAENQVATQAIPATGTKAKEKVVLPEIYGILVSDGADLDGYVTKNKLLIPATSQNLYVTVQITDATPGIKVSATIKGNQSGTVTDTAMNTTSKSGNIMKAFTFTNTNRPWPPGQYTVEVKLSTGASKAVTFNIG